MFSLQNSAFRCTKFRSKKNVIKITIKKDLPKSNFKYRFSVEKSWKELFSRKFKNSHDSIIITRKPDSEVGSLFLCGVCESNVTWSKNAVYCETCCVWFHVDSQDIGRSSFQALQDPNVSWHCLNCNALNYHTVSSNFLEDLIISNRLKP